MAGQVELMQHMNHQRAEAAAEIDVLARRDALIAEHQQMMVQVRLMDAGKILARQFARQVQANDLGAQRTRQRAQLEGLRLGGLRFRLRVHIAQQGIALGHRSLLGVRRIAGPD